MLKKFFLNTLSSFLGAWIALVIFGIAALCILLGSIAKFGISQSASNNIKKGSVLTIHLEGEIIENEQGTDIDYISLVSGDIEKKKTLAGLTQAIEAAANNKNIEAIYLKCGMTSAAPATYDAIRQSLIKFKESGKKIYAYGNQMMMGTYYIASVADGLYLNPDGNVLLQGLGNVTLFYKDLLQ